ncbi:MAG TPA: EamA family transporter, partial [Azospirillaceae bacterium]|nr:EamA family transporter [Azospirillaceae bacterium]
ALVCVMATVLYALALLLAGRLARTEGSAATVFYFTLTCTGVGAVLMGPDWVTPTAGDFLLLAITGLVGGTAQFLMTESVRVAPPSVVAPFDYTAMIWAVALGYAVFGDVPTGGVLLGGAVVAASGIMLLRLETRRSPMVAEAS